MAVVSKRDVVSSTVSKINLSEENNIYSDFDISLVMYDSTVDNGKTQLTEINWNATSNTTRVVIVQVNFKNDNASTVYYPGELRITVDNLGKIVPVDSAGTTFLRPTSIGADSEYVDEKTYDWTYRYDAENEQYIFTNNNMLEADANFEGTIQLAYEINSANILNNSSVEVDANLNDIVYSSNKLKFSFTSTEKPASVSVSASKLLAYDGLIANPESYIWIKYSYNVSTNNSNGVRGVIYDDYILAHINEYCVMLDSSLVQM